MEDYKKWVCQSIINHMEYMFEYLRESNEELEKYGLFGNPQKAINNIELSFKKRNEAEIVS